MQGMYDLFNEIPENLWNNNFSNINIRINNISILSRLPTLSELFSS